MPIHWGRLRFEPSLRFAQNAEGYKILPGTIRTIVFSPNDKRSAAIDIENITSSVLYFYLLEKLQTTNGVSDNVRMEIIREENETEITLGINFTICKTGFKSALQNQLFAIKFTVPTREKYVFQAPDELAAQRCFLGLFSHLSFSIDERILAEYGIQCLERQIDSEWYEIFPNHPYGNESIHLLRIPLKELVE